mmetsp:Transcript_7938/g.22747  ORF Transcript_7938/g.22747 Transcript_7938/m.22747 type:complete len:80 (+) Transcript_7938:467-706(+)
MSRGCSCAIVQEEFPHIIVDGHETRCSGLFVLEEPQQKVLYSVQGPRRPHIDSVIFLMRNMGMGEVNFDFPFPACNPCH